MTTAVIAAFLRPFVGLAVLVLICYPIKRLAWRYLPDGWLKRMLFTSWRT